jgi:hypothetical protein
VLEAMQVHYSGDTAFDEHGVFKQLVYSATTKLVSVTPGNLSELFGDTMFDSYT